MGNSIAYCGCEDSRDGVQLKPAGGWWWMGYDDGAPSLNYAWLCDDHARQWGAQKDEPAAFDSPPSPLLIEPD